MHCIRMTFCILIQSFTMGALCIIIFLFFPLAFESQVAHLHITILFQAIINKNVNKIKSNTTYLYIKPNLFYSNQLKK